MALRLKKIFQLTSPKLKGKPVEIFKSNELQHIINIAALKLATFQ